MTTIEQKKFGNHHTFTFNLDAVNCAYQDGSAAGEINVPYSAIPKKTVTQHERPQWLQNVGCLSILLGVFDVGRALVGGYTLTGTGAWILFGLVCIALTRAFTVTYTVFQTHHGNLFVIRDGTHDRVIDELLARRKEYLRSAHDHIDVDRSAEEDLATFEWLRDEGALTTEEFEKRAEKARLAARRSSTGSATER